MSNNTPQNIEFGRIAAILPVKDIDKALKFYTGVLGFTKVFENGTPTGFVILKSGDAELHLTLQPHHKTPHFNVAHVMVNCVDTVYNLCVSNKIRIIKRLENKEYGLRAFVFEDPDGNRIDVGQDI